MPPANQRGWTNAGAPAANCLLYTYEAGTTTPKATYTDAAKTAEHENPIRLNAKGEALIYWEGAYRIELRTAAGVLVTGYPVDNYETPLMAGTLSPAAGAGMIGFVYATAYGVGTIGRWLKDLALEAGSTFMGFLQAGTGAILQTVEQKLRSHRPTIWDFLSPAKRITLLAGTQTDVTTELQAALDAHLHVEIFGNLKITDTIYLKRNGACLRGRGIGNTTVEFVNAAGGTAFAGAVSTSVTITNCEMSDFSIAGNAAGTSASIGVDLTTFAYSIFRLSIQTRRVNGICYYGQGNTGSSPYYNRIEGYLFGGADYTQTGIKFAQGAWAGGSNGANANMIGPIYRGASLQYLIDLQAGNGNMFSNISGESIGDGYLRLNFNAAEASGTSSGSNTMSTLNDTTKTWTANQYVGYGVKITSGTGSGQTRTVKNNTATSLGLNHAWGVKPDATSVYALYKNAANSNKFNNLRAEGLSTLNPDFIAAYPGTNNNSVTNSYVESLGSGFVIYDDSGSPTNVWQDGQKCTWTETVSNPGPSANIDIYPRNSIFGGVMLTNYTLEWVAVAINSATPGDNATVYLDCGGTAANTSTETTLACITNEDFGMTLTTPTQKLKRDGLNRRMFLNLQTGAAFSGTADVTITWCATIDL